MKLVLSAMALAALTFSQSMAMDLGSVTDAAKSATKAAETVEKAKDAVDTAEQVKDAAGAASALGGGSMTDTLKEKAVDKAVEMADEKTDGMASKAIDALK